MPMSPAPAVTNRPENLEGASSSNSSISMNLLEVVVLVVLVVVMPWSGAGPARRGVEIVVGVAGCHRAGCAGDGRRGSHRGLRDG